MSDDTPTQRIPQEPDETGELVEERKKSKALLYSLVGLGAALLVVIIVLFIMLFGGGKTTPDSSPTPSDTPSASPTPSDSPTPTESPTPSPTPTPTAAAAPPAPPPPPSVIVSYSVSDNNVDCSESGGDPIPITFNWNTTGTSVNFGVGTEFADSEPYTTGLPGVGGVTIDYQCGQSGDQQKYAIAVFHNGDVIARKTMVVAEH